MRTIDLIAAKRDGRKHTADEIQFLVANFTVGRIPDYQMSAWLMAVVCRGLTEDETIWLVDSMIASGDHLTLPAEWGFTLDKHSTGGVGDKTTLAVVPILASLGIKVVKMSGRGLGHTGGTLDKLESIEGFRTQLTEEQIIGQVEAIGACISAQTRTLVPADKLMYALRDSTATVNSLPLIAASIMSKKLVCNSNAIVLDVKVGSGGFMKTVEEARQLSDLMIRIGAARGKHVVSVLSNMNSPLGYNIGNLVEVREVVALLKGNPWIQGQFRELVLHICAVGCVLAGLSQTIEEGITLAGESISSGRALSKLCELVQYQGGSVEQLLHTIKQPSAKIKYDIHSNLSGTIDAVDAEAIGLAAMRLGAGRGAIDDAIDPTSGILLRKHVGSEIEVGTVIATLLAPNTILAREVEESVRGAFSVGLETFPLEPAIIETRGL